MRQLGKDFAPGRKLYGTSHKKGIAGAAGSPAGSRSATPPAGRPKRVRTQTQFFGHDPGAASFVERSDSSSSDSDLQLQQNDRSSTHGAHAKHSNVQHTPQVTVDSPASGSRHAAHSHHLAAAAQQPESAFRSPVSEGAADSAHPFSEHPQAIDTDMLRQMPQEAKPHAEQAPGMFDTNLGLAGGPGMQSDVDTASPAKPTTWAVKQRRSGPVMCPATYHTQVQLEGQQEALPGPAANPAHAVPQAISDVATMKQSASMAPLQTHSTLARSGVAVPISEAISAVNAQLPVKDAITASQMQCYDYLHELLELDNKDIKKNLEIVGGLNPNQVLYMYKYIFNYKAQYKVTTETINSLIS